MRNNESLLNDNNIDKTYEKSNDFFNEIITPKKGAPVLQENKKNNINLNGINDIFSNSNKKINENFFHQNKNIKKECISSNISSSIEQLSLSNLKKNPVIIRNRLKKFVDMDCPLSTRYSNAFLFNNRVSRHLIFSGRNKQHLVKMNSSNNLDPTDKNSISGGGKPHNLKQSGVDRFKSNLKKEE